MLLLGHWDWSRELAMESCDWDLDAGAVSLGLESWDWCCNPVNGTWILGLDHSDWNEGTGTGIL